MASTVPRKRKQDESQMCRVEKCPRVGENDSQEVFCVDSDDGSEVDDGDCIVVSERISIKRGTCQNPACLTPEGTKLQKASRRVQDFYGHSWKKGRIWRICEVCNAKAEEYLGKLKNRFINHVPIVESQFPFYGDMATLDKEDSTDDDEEEPLDDTVAEFMSNCASDMINSIFEKYDINFQVEEGVKKLLEGYEKFESEIQAQIKSCDDIASSFRSSCEDFYKENEYYREELPAVEIDCGPEEVTIDDNSDADDVIVVESVVSLQNMPEELNENTSLTQSQTHPACPTQSPVTEQTPESRTILPDVPHATATNQRIFGELRTIVKLSGGNSGSSSKETGVVNGRIPEKRKSDKQSVPVHAAGTDGMLSDSNTRASGTQSSAQKHQTASEAESDPIHCVPLQQLLQKGLSVLGAQPGTTNMREKRDHKEQQPSSQLSKENTLHKSLQQRFSVLNSAIETASAQEKQNKAHQLHRHTAPVSQQQKVTGNVQSMQQQKQQQHVNKMPHNTVNQQSRQQVPPTNPQSSGHYVSQPPQHLTEQRIQQVPPQPTGYSPPKSNLQLAPRVLQQHGSQIPRQASDQNIVQTVRSSNDHNVSKELSHRSQTVCQPQQFSTQQSAQQSSTQVMSRTSLQPSGQQVISTAQDSIARNTYHTSKQSFQQTAAQLPPQPSVQSLACVQQQPSGYVSQAAQQPSGQYIPQSFQQSSGKSVSNPPQSVLQQHLQSDSKQKSLPQQQSSGQQFYQSSQQPGGHNVSQISQQLNNHTSKQSFQQTAAQLPPQPSVQSLACVQQQPSGYVSQAVQQPSGQYIPQSFQQSSGKSVSNPPQSVLRQQLQSDSKQKSLPQQQSSGQQFYQSSQQPGGHNVSQISQQLNNKYVSQPSKEHVSSGAHTVHKPNFANSAAALQTFNQTTSLKTPPTVQNTPTQQAPRMTVSVLHQNMQKRLNMITGQVPQQPKEFPNIVTGPQTRQHQTGQNVLQSPQGPAVQASLPVPHTSNVKCVSGSPQEATQQNLQHTPLQNTARKLLPSTNHLSVQSESQKPLQSNVSCAPVSPQLTNRVTQPSHENNSTQAAVQPTVENKSTNLVQQSRHFPPQIVQNSSVTPLPPSSQPNIPSLNRPPQQDIRQTVQIVSQTGLTRQSNLTETPNRQNVAVNQEKKTEEPVAKTHQQLNGLRNMLSTCQQSGQQTHNNTQIFKSQCLQKQNRQPISQSLQQSGEQKVSQVTNPHVIQTSTMCNQQQTSQSVRELSEPNSLKLQQQKQQATSHVVLSNRRETESCLQRPSESSVPGKHLTSSELQQQQQQQQQKQYGPSSSSQQPQQLTSRTESNTGSHQACSKTQAQDPKNHLQLSEEKTQQSSSNAVLLQNMSQPLQHLKNRQSEKTEVKVQPVIPLQKSQSSDQEGRPHHSDQQISSAPVSQVVPQQLHSFSTNNLQLTANVSQQSVVSQFPGNLFVMLQQQQVTMMLGFVCDILSRFLPMVTQQQCQRESTQVAVAPSSVNTVSSKEQNSKVVANQDDLRLSEKDGTEMSDTESMCQSPVDSSTPFSTPTKSVMCTSPSTLSSSTDSDISVSDSIEVYAEKEVVTVGKIVIRECNLPPLGLVKRPPVVTGESMYIMNDIKRPWIFATVRDIVTQNYQTLYTVEFMNSKNMKETKKVAGFQLAYSRVQDFRFSVGHRVISIFRDGISDEDYYSGVIAEPPKSINSYRYLVFFDNGGSQYVQHQDIRLVMESSPSVWEDVHIEIREFVQNYLEKYPERALLKVQEGQEVRTEWNRRWYIAKVLKVDASLARMSFPSNGKHIEWIYRGSARFYPLFEAQNRTSKEQFARSKAFARKRGDPYIQYTLREEEELEREIKDEGEVTIEESEPMYRPTARKSTTSQITSTASKRVTYKTHRCKPSCVATGSPVKDYTNYRNLLSHLSEPMLHGWTREKVKHSEYVSVYYRTPCKRRLRNIEELHKYLLLTKSKLTVDQFDFDHWVRCFTDGINEKYFVKIEDISNGVEAVPIPCINTVDSRKPEEITYVTKHVPTKGTYIETDPEFLICCDCTDDCLDKEKCACWRQTMEGVKYSPESESPNHEGYYYKRLYEPLVTGIYECNSRLVQLPMKCKVQVFMTPNRGWGIRALHDIPKGSFICLYAGHVLSEKVGDALAKEVGDEYQADLDYIESAEKVKEDYEEDAYENESEEECGRRQNSKQKGQTTASRKSSSKHLKIVVPSTRVLFGRNGRYILDAKTCGNVGRYINHSCNANLFAQNVFVDTHDLRFPWVAFFTNSFVPANTELTWNYGYDVDSVPERVIICKCGEANCQGRLL